MKKLEERLAYRATTYFTEKEMEKFGKKCRKKGESQAKMLREIALAWMEND